MQDMLQLDEWLEAHTAEGVYWYAKRLSANDTGATSSHQVGPHIGKDFVFIAFPELADRIILNPEIRLSAYIASHDDKRDVRLVWYNSKYHGKTRNETRITQWGGASSPLLDVENTGALTIFSFDPTKKTLAVWIATTLEEEVEIEALIGEVEPGSAIAWPMNLRSIPAITCRLKPSQISPAWLLKFPKGSEIVDLSVSMQPLPRRPSDVRLIKRRACELEIFGSIEEAFERGRISKGYGSISDFIDHAKTVLQRRKSRSGRSLELQVLKILEEEGLKKDKSYSYNKVSEGNKKPDFLFPSHAAYQDKSYAAANLRMLAVKTTCKDRWRQVINEADRVPEKHLLTLQEGVSINQFSEMKKANIKLVVPKANIKKFPNAVRRDLIDVETFLATVKRLPAH
jgi:hypothetical protein